MRWLSDYIKIYEVGVLFVCVRKYLRRHFWRVVILLVTKNLYAFLSLFAWTLRSDYYPLLSSCTLTSFASRESVKTPRAVVAQV